MHLTSGMLMGNIFVAAVISLVTLLETVWGCDITFESGYWVGDTLCGYVVLYPSMDAVW